MPKMKDRNAQLRGALGAIAPKERIIEANSVPKENTVNRQGKAAYSYDDKLKLVMMLNTLKIQPQFYRSENEQLVELRDLIERIALNDPYFVAQAIVWSRCLGEGMRTINHLAAALLAPFASGLSWGKRFYNLFDKNKKQGGCIFRPDDMSEIKDAYEALTGKPLSNAMRKGFAEAIVRLDTYSLAKYKDSIIDITNLSHAKSKLSTAVITVNGERVKTIDALMRGISVSADTWEVAQSEAGQEVAKAVREGKLTKEEAEKTLAEAKADNWESLLKDGKLGILAALRNIRNILQNPREDTINEWCDLIKDSDRVRKALILPIHFDLAYDIVDNEFGNNKYANKVRQALQDGYIAAMPNLKAALPGKTLIVIDCSGSMGGYRISNGKSGYDYWNSRGGARTQMACYKAGLIAATFASALDADVIQFGSSAKWASYNKFANVFAMAQELGGAWYGSTNPAAAFDLIRREHKVYDRIIFISDNEVNGRLTSSAYKQYIHDVCSPYIYGIDLCAYGTAALAGDKVSYYFGYGPSMYEAVAAHEFNPESVMKQIESMVI
jgi:hypothetical protein